MDMNKDGQMIAAVAIGEKNKGKGLGIVSPVCGVLNCRSDINEGLADVAAGQSALIKLSDDFFRQADKARED
jgi:hypothetical protein